MASGSFVFHKNTRKLSQDLILKLKSIIHKYTLTGAARMLKSAPSTLETIASGGARKVSTIERLEKALNDVAM